jgi:hypothetical protein
MLGGICDDRQKSSCSGCDVVMEAAHCNPQVVVSFIVGALMSKFTTAFANAVM